MKLAQRGPPETEDALPFLEVFIADASDEIRRKKHLSHKKKPYDIPLYYLVYRDP